MKNWKTPKMTQTNPMKTWKMNPMMIWKTNHTKKKATKTNPTPMKTKTNRMSTKMMMKNQKLLPSPGTNQRLVGRGLG